MVFAAGPVTLRLSSSRGMLSCGFQLAKTGTQGLDWYLRYPEMGFVQGPFTAFVAFIGCRTDFSELGRSANVLLS